MSILEPISAFAISIAANIATGYLTHRSQAVKKEIEEAFEEVKIKNYSPEIRKSLAFHRKWDQIKVAITAQITSSDDFNSLFDEAQHILEDFKEVIATRQNAYNYLKDITDSERYANEFRILEELHEGVANANQKLDRLTLLPFIDKEEFLTRYPLNGKFLRNNYIDSIISKLQDFNNKIIRFVALSGMGKTRIIREAFSNTNSDLYYCESSEDSKVMSVLRTIFTQSSSDGIVILDNCSIRRFDEILSLKEECGAEQRIISVSNDMQEPQLLGMELIRLQTPDLQEMVDDYIAERLGGKENVNYSRITKFAEGIPYMAILLCDALARNGKPGYIDNETIFYKLLGIDQSNPEDSDDRKILEACSLFMPLGYSERYACQSDFVATCDYLTELQGADIVKKRKFRRVCDKYIERQLMEHISDHINVRPMPLAIWLASEWFKGCTKDHIMSLIQGISNIPSDEHDHAKHMQEAFCRRLEYLTENRVAKEVLTELMQLQGPFAHEEILNTSMGSRLLLSFANVIPEVVADTLYGIYADYDIDKLKLELADDARRNFVYVLEKICYNKNCFHKAALVLARLALAENETWSNNSLGLFRQLFHILIPGTEANLQDRFEVIRACKRQGREYIDLALTAINSALSADGFMRMVGAQQQGFHVYKDYQPTYPEIYEYWRNCKNLLIEITEEFPEKLDDITRVVENHIDDFLKVNCVDMLYELLDYYIPKKEHNWDNVLKTLNRISENPESYDFDKTKLDAYIKRLTKTDFHSRFTTIREKETRNFKRPFEDTIRAINQQYEILAEEYVNDQWNNDELLKQFYANDFTFADVFAIRICELEKGDCHKRDFFINCSVDILTENPDSKGKSLFIYYCSALNDLKFLETVVAKISKAKIYPVLFATIGSCLPKLGERFYKDLLTLVSDLQVGADNFKEFFNYLPYSLDPSSRLKFFKEISDLGMKARIALSNNIQWIVHNKAYQALPDFAPFIEQYITDLLVDNDKKETYFRTVMDMAEAYLTTFDKPNFAQFVHQKILESFQNNTGYDAEIIYHTLLKKYKNEIWPELSEALLGGQDKFMVNFRLSHILGAHLGLRSSLLCDYYDEDFLIQWCKENTPIAPQRLASMIPVYQSEGLEHFSSIMMKLLDLFGDDEEVLSNLSCNMGSFAWTGSVIPLFQTQLTALRELVNHKHYAVIRWAKKLIEYTEQTIKKETDKEAFDRLIRS